MRLKVILRIFLLVVIVIIMSVYIHLILQTYYYYKDFVVCSNCYNYDCYIYFYDIYLILQAYSN